MSVEINTPTYSGPDRRKTAIKHSSALQDHFSGIETAFSDETLLAFPDITKVQGNHIEKIRSLLNESDLTNPDIENQNLSVRKFLDAIVKFSLKENDSENMLKQPWYRGLSGKRLLKTETHTVDGIQFILSYEHDHSRHSILHIKVPEYLTKYEKGVIAKVEETLLKSKRMQDIISLNQKTMGFQIGEERQRTFYNKNSEIHGKNELKRDVKEKGIQNVVRKGDILTDSVKELRRK